MSEYEPMAEKTPGIPTSLPDNMELSPELTDQMNSDIADLKALGVEVTGAAYNSLDAPPRYMIRFNAEEPMFKTRMRLEKELWDVGQNMGQGGKNLSFYAIRRVTKSEGWQV